MAQSRALEVVLLNKSAAAPKHGGGDVRQRAASPGHPAPTPEGPGRKITGSGSLAVPYVSGDDIRFLPRWRIGYPDRPPELVPMITLREERWKMRSSLVLAAFIGARVPWPGIARADGLLYQLPEDRSWVRLDAQSIHRGVVWPPLNRAAHAGTPP